MNERGFDRTKLTDAGRLRALARTGLMDTEREEGFDRLTRLVSRLLNVPISLVSLVDHDRQFFKSGYGLEGELATERQTPLSHSFCQHVVTGGAPLVIENAKEHPAVCDNPAIPEFGVAAYAGVPILSPEGHVLGSLCALDMKTRSWSEEDLQNLRDISKIVMSEITLRQEIKQRTGAEKQQELLIGELNHRVKNILASASAIVQLSGRTAGSIPEYRERVNERLAALAKTQDLLTEQHWRAADLRDILLAELKPFEKTSQIKVDGPRIDLPAQQAALFGMATHELTTNAAKYGALSTHGQLRVTWSVEPKKDGHLLSLDWIERGGPAVTTPSRRGFGTDLIERLVSGEAKGKVELKYPPEGFQARIEFFVAGTQPD